VNELALMLGVDDVDPVLGEVLLLTAAPPEELLPHAETMRPAPASAATYACFRVKRTKCPPWLGRAAPVGSV
jgi:hypothetical protein